MCVSVGGCGYLLNYIMSVDVCVCVCGWVGGCGYLLSYIMSVDVCVCVCVCVCVGYNNC